MSCAKSVLIFGHITSGMGERTLALKFKRALEQTGYRVSDVIDLVHFLAEDYQSLAEINYDLADVGYPMLSNLKSVMVPPCDRIVILSWAMSVASLYGAGIFNKCPVIASLYAHHPEERLPIALYQPASLLITESLLANERALFYGLEPGRILCIPHSYPQECEQIVASREYVYCLAEQQGKTIRPSTQIVGCVSRLEYGKNCEYALEAVRQLYYKGKDVLLCLKGYFSEPSYCPEYQKRLKKLLEAYAHEPWLIWDASQTPFPQVIGHYGSFDVLLHPSGAEGGSHVVIECLGLLKPVILLSCSTNPFLFQGVANFVKTTKELQPGPLPFYLPDIQDLCRVLENPLLYPDPKLVARRFHEKEMEQRMDLLFEPDPKLIEELYAYDRYRFNL